MKKFLISFSIGLFSLSLLIGCNKNNSTDNNTPGDFPAGVNDNISSALMDTLRKAGMIIHPGTRPPNVTGFYAMKLDSTIYAGGMKINDTEKFGDPLVFSFYNQDTVNNTIKVAFKDALDISFSGSAISKTYVSGSGNDFTIFSSAAYLSGYGASVTFMLVISGTLTKGGISNLQSLTYVLSKTDGNNSGFINPVGYISIDVEAYPFFTPKVSSY